MESEINWDEVLVYVDDGRVCAVTVKAKIWPGFSVRMLEGEGREWFLKEAAMRESLKDLEKAESILDDLTTYFIARTRYNAETPKLWRTALSYAIADLRRAAAEIEALIGGPG